MAYHDLGILPALHELGQQFTVCDRWFCSVPGAEMDEPLVRSERDGAGPGKAAGRDLPSQPAPLRPANDLRPSESGRKDWRIYFGDFPLSLLFASQRRLSMARHYARMKHFAKDVRAAAADPRRFPTFVFIEPSYLWPSPNDDHPPHDVRDGQELIADVYNTLHAVESTLFDHTSVLRYLLDKWSLGALGKRTAAAASIGVTLRPGPPPDDTPPAISGLRAVRGVRRRRAAARAAVPEALNDNQKAILAFSQALERDTAGPPSAKVVHSMRLMRGPRDQFAVARTRVEQFLKQRSARL